MTVENLKVEGFKGFVIAIPEGDDLLEWVVENCPEKLPEAEFFRFLCLVGQQFMTQSMEKLHTNAEGVLQFVEHPELALVH